MPSRTVDIKHTGSRYYQPVQFFALYALFPIAGKHQKVTVNINKGGVSDRHYSPEIKHVLNRNLKNMTERYPYLKNFSGTATIINDLSKGEGLPIKIEFDQKNTD